MVFLTALLVVSAWRSVDWFCRERAKLWAGSARWVLLTRMTPEEFDHGRAHRYRDLARDLGGERDVGYFSEQDGSVLWSDAFSPEGADRIERYYMAQGILPPSLLRLDERWPRVVVDCKTDDQAQQVVTRKLLKVVHNYGQGLLLAQPAE
jgi:hypothetical protein